MTKLIISYRDTEAEIELKTTTIKEDVLKTITLSIEQDVCAMFETKDRNFVILPTDVLQQSIIVIKD